MTPVLKYVFKNSAFVYIFRGLLCSCTLPVRLTSFIHQTLADYGEDLHFFPPHFYQHQRWMEDLQDQILTCMNHIAKVGSPAFIPEQGGQFGI